MAPEGNTSGEQTQKPLTAEQILAVMQRKNIDGDIQAVWSEVRSHIDAVLKAHPDVSSDLRSNGTRLDPVDKNDSMKGAKLREQKVYSVSDLQRLTVKLLGDVMNEGTAFHNDMVKAFSMSERLKKVLSDPPKKPEEKKDGENDDEKDSEEDHDEKKDKDEKPKDKHEDGTKKHSEDEHSGAHGHKDGHGHAAATIVKPKKPEIAEDAPKYKKAWHYCAKWPFYLFGQMPMYGAKKTAKFSQHAWHQFNRPFNYINKGFENGEGFFGFTSLMNPNPRKFWATRWMFNLFNKKSDSAKHDGHH